MARRIEVSRGFAGSVSAAETVWYDPHRWASWVDGFGHVARLSEDWPHAGAELVWDSLPGGRGRVAERVESHVAREGQRVAIEDARLQGIQEVAFALDEDDGVRVTLALEYELKGAGPLRAVIDPLFIRRALDDSLRRTLARFGVELEADLARPLR